MPIKLRLITSTTQFFVKLNIYKKIYHDTELQITEFQSQQVDFRILKSTIVGSTTQLLNSDVTYKPLASVYGLLV